MAMHVATETANDHCARAPTYNRDAVSLGVFLIVRGDAVWSKPMAISQFLGDFPDCGTRIASIWLLPSTSACLRAEDTCNVI